MALELETESLGIKDLTWLITHEDYVIILVYVFIVKISYV